MSLMQLIEENLREMGSAMIQQKIEARPGKKLEKRWSTRPKKLMKQGKGFRNTTKKKASSRKSKSAAKTRCSTRGRGVTSCSSSTRVDRADRNSKVENIFGQNEEEKRRTRRRRAKTEGRSRKCCSFEDDCCQYVLLTSWGVQPLRKTKSVHRTRPCAPSQVFVFGCLFFVM